MSDRPGGRASGWVAAGVVAVALLDLWLRGHTIAPALAERAGVRLWPVVSGQVAPLDSDEAAYAYIGRRIGRGDVMYRDLVEHKPPGGYGLFALAVALGGANELTVRLLPVPLVLATLAGIAWLGGRIGGPVAAVVAALVYALMSTDPHLSGDAATLEHPLNLLAVGSLALMVRASEPDRRDGRRRWALAGAGACVAGACLVRQVAVTHLVVYAVAVLVRRGSLGSRGWDLAVLLGGFAGVAGLAVIVLAGQGALADAYDQVVVYAAAQTAGAFQPRGAPPWLVRWVVGEIDPRDGRLPWPFGDAPDLRWWGAGLWAVWLGTPPLLALLAGRWPTAPRRLLAAWAVSAAVQIALPGLFWQHYYLLLAPAAALAWGGVIGECLRRAGAAAHGPDPTLYHVWAAAATALLAVLALSGSHLARSYLTTPADELQAVFKGGTAWAPLRTIGREIGRRAHATWTDPRLFVWGWQSPIYIYADLDGVSREVFTDPLLESRARTDPRDPVIAPRLRRIIADLSARPPEVVFVGVAPFPALRDFLDAHYALWRAMPGAGGGEGIWVLRADRDRFAAHAADPPEPGRRGAP